MSDDWRNYVDSNGDFALPFYLYKTLNGLMKACLDYGTLLSEDKAKLRAYKEQTKNLFKKRWLEVAQSLESFDLIVPCICEQNEYCKICGGSRYILNSNLSSDKMREVAVVFGAEQNAELADKLHKGLVKALKDLDLDYDELPTV